MVKTPSSILMSLALPWITRVILLWAGQAYFKIQVLSLLNVLTIQPQKQGPELSVSNNTTFFASSADVAMDSDGDFIVSWSEREEGSKYGINNSNSIYAKTYSSTGAFIEKISDIESQLTASSSSVALDDDGDVAFAWQGRDEESNGIEKYSIYTRRYKLNLIQPN